MQFKFLKELVWNDMKAYIGNEVKPNTVEELVHGILEFWRLKVTREYCNSKIDHLDKVIKTIILLKGKAFILINEFKTKIALVLLNIN